MIASALFTSHRAIDPHGFKPRSQLAAEKEMVDAQPRIPRPPIPLVVPERIDPISRMQLADGIDPSLL